MRIRMFHAFASNNSGSYTIVGSFGDAVTAEEVARLIQEVSDAHSTWRQTHQWDGNDESPLDVFARREGLRAVNPGLGDEWPNYGDDPKVVACGKQVLMHVPYTVTMPAMFGELFYARGGRVDAELDHAHEDLAVELSYWPAELRWDDPRRGEVLDTFESLLAAELPGWTSRPEHDNRPAIAPAWHRGAWGSRHLWVVFGDLVQGVQGVQHIAREAGIHLHIRVWECPHGVTDPFAALRVEQSP